MILGRMLTAGGAAQPFWSLTDKDADFTISSGGRLFTAPTTTTGSVRSTVGIAGGKHHVQMIYAEDGVSTAQGLYGLATAAHDITTWLGNTAASWAINSAGRLRTGVGGGGSTTSYHTYTSSDMIDIFVDITAGKIWYGVNGVAFVGSPVAGTDPMHTFPPGSKVFLGGGKAGGSGITTGSLPRLGDYVGSPLAGYLRGW